MSRQMSRGLHTKDTVKDRTGGHVSESCGCFIEFVFHSRKGSFN